MWKADMDSRRLGMIASSVKQGMLEDYLFDEKEKHLALKS